MIKHSIRCIAALGVLSAGCASDKEQLKEQSTCESQYRSCYNACEVSYPAGFLTQYVPAAPDTVRCYQGCQTGFETCIDPCYKETQDLAGCIERSPEDAQNRDACIEKANKKLERCRNRSKP